MKRSHPFVYWGRNLRLKDGPRRPAMNNVESVGKFQPRAGVEARAKEMSDTLQFVMIFRKKALSETSDKLKCVGHSEDHGRLYRAPNLRIGSARAVPFGSLSFQTGSKSRGVNERQANDS